VDPLTLVISVGSAVVAGTAAVVVGRKRGLQQADERLDRTTAELVDRLQARVDLLERERAEDRALIATLQAKVHQLEVERDALTTALTRVGHAG